MPVKAMILAAGTGTRLRPITENRPKALVEINGKPLLEWVIRRLRKAGIRDMIVNVHHFPNQIRDFLERKEFFNLNIRISDESSQLMDTGGALQKARACLDDGKPFLVHNVDILTDLDIPAFIAHHVEHRNAVSLTVRARNTSRYLLFDSRNTLCGWENNKSGARILVGSRPAPVKKLAFSGIHIAGPELFEYIPGKTPCPVIRAYLQMAEDHDIKGVEHNEGTWTDVGKIRDLKKGAEFVCNHPELFGI